MRDLRYFRFWCQSVLPLVYDGSLSYYEVLCKVVKYINDLIDSDKEIVGNITELRRELAVVQEWIDNFNNDYIEKLFEELLPTMVFFGLTEDGYFVAYIPENWNDIQFATTGYDINVDIMPDYGHLVLLY